MICIATVESIAFYWAPNWVTRIRNTLCNYHWNIIPGFWNLTMYLEVEASLKLHNSSESSKRHVHLTSQLVSSHSFWEYCLIWKNLLITCKFIIIIIISVKKKDKIKSEPLTHYQKMRTKIINTPKCKYF